MRLPWPAVVGGTAAIVLGAAGLIRAAVPQSSAVPVASGPGQVTVADAYVRAPLPPGKVAAAYFTVYNTTSRPDRVVGVLTGAGEAAVLHDEVNGRMVALANGAAVPAHGKLVLRAGGKHVMIEHLFDKLVAGQTVNIEVDFAHAASVDVVAPVIPYGAAPPTS